MGGMKNGKVKRLNKKELAKLKGLPREIEDLERELDGMEKYEPVADVIKDYRTGYPKAKVIRGFSPAQYLQRQALLEKKIRQKQSLVNRFEDWIETVPDADMRRLLRYIYLHGMSQKRAAELIGKGWTRDAVAQRLKRFFEKF